MYVWKDLSKVEYNCPHNTSEKNIVFLLMYKKQIHARLFEPKFVQKTHQTKSNSRTFRRLKSLLLNQNQEQLFFIFH